MPKSMLSRKPSKKGAPLSDEEEDETRLKVICRWAAKGSVEAHDEAAKTFFDDPDIEQLRC